MCATIFSIANQKGGVGKTTTAINLSAAFSVQKVPTLLIDLDPQANSTSGLGLQKKEGGSLYGPLLGEGSAKDHIVKTDNPYLDIIPSELDLAAVEIELAQKKDYLLQLKRCLAPIIQSNTYKAILIDCPPALGLLSINSLVAAHHLLVTLQCEYLAMEGLSQIIKTVDNLKSSQANPNLSIGGIIMTLFDGRTKLCEQVLSDVKSHFKSLVFKTVIPRSIRIGEAPSFGQSILDYDPNGIGAKAYKALGSEIIKRFSLK